MARRLRIVLLGATGETGQPLLRLCLDRGHHVLAVVRDMARLNMEHHNLRLVEADIFSAESLTPIFRGQLNVSSCDLGLTMSVQDRTWSSPPSASQSSWWRRWPSSLRAWRRYWRPWKLEVWTGSSPCPPGIRTQTPGNSWFILFHFPKSEIRGLILTKGCNPVFTILRHGTCH